MKKTIYGIFYALVLVLTVAAFVCMAGTTDKTQGSGTAGFPAKFAGNMFLYERTLDFASSADTGTASEVYQCFYVPAGSFVVGAGWEIETAEDSTLWLTLGDGTDTDGWIASEPGSNGTTRAFAWSGTNVISKGLAGLTNNLYAAYGMGKLYTSADTIDLKLSHNADKLKITVRALVIPVTGL